MVLKIFFFYLLNLFGLKVVPKQDSLYQIHSYQFALYYVCELQLKNKQKKIVLKAF